MPSPVVSSRIIENLGPCPDPDQVDFFWREVAAVTPLIEPADEGHRIVTFCWRDGEAEQVLLFVNRIADNAHLEDSLMRRVGNTDIWHLSYRMPSDWRASYSFVPRYPTEPVTWIGEEGEVAIRQAVNRGRRDPSNPEICRNRLGVAQSVVALPDAPPQPWLEPRPEVLEGGLETVPGPGGRAIWSYRSPGPTDRPPTLLIVFDGDVWVSRQSLPVTLDNLTADGLIPPVHVLLVDSGDRDTRLAELESGALEDWVADRLIPWAHNRWPLDPGAAVVAGQSLGGLAALRIGLRRPDVVGTVIAQSASLWVDDLAALIAAPRPSTPRIYLEAGRYEWLLVEPHRALAERLASAGAEICHAEFAGGHDYACWRGTIADALIWAFGPRLA